MGLRSLLKKLDWKVLAIKVLTWGVSKIQKRMIAEERRRGTIKE